MLSVHGARLVDHRRSMKVTSTTKSKKTRKGRTKRKEVLEKVEDVSFDDLDSDVGIVLDDDNVFEGKATEENVKATLSKMEELKQELDERRQKLLEKSTEEEEQQQEEQEQEPEEELDEGDNHKEVQEEQEEEQEPEEELHEVNNDEDVQEDQNSSEDVKETLDSYDKVQQQTEMMYSEEFEEADMHATMEEGTMEEPPAETDFEISQEHVSDSQTKDLVQCETCETVFETQEEFDEHNADCYPDPLECEFCPSVFTSEAEKREHECNLGPNPVECQTCQVKFFNSYHLYNHMEKQHTDQNNGCQTCIDGFKFMQEYYLHVDEFHSDIEYKCEDCLTKFKTRSELNHHVKTEHGENMDTACPSCKEVFGNLGALRRHRKTCSASLETVTATANVLQCHECKKHVPQENLPQHLALHNKGVHRVPKFAASDTRRKVKCPLCEKHVQGSYLPHHMKQHAGHRDAEEYKLYKGKVMGQMEECDRCGSVVSTFYMEKHKNGTCKGRRMEVSFTADGKVRCDKCDRTMTLRYLEKHQAQYCKGKRGRRKKKKSAEEEEEELSADPEQTREETRLDRTNNKDKERISEESNEDSLQNTREIGDEIEEEMSETTSERIEKGEVRRLKMSADSGKDEIRAEGDDESIKKLPTDNTGDLVNESESVEMTESQSRQPARTENSTSPAKSLRRSARQTRRAARQEELDESSQEVSESCLEAQSESREEIQDSTMEWQEVTDVNEELEESANIVVEIDAQFAERIETMEEVSADELQSAMEGKVRVIKVDVRTGDKEIELVDEEEREDGLEEGEIPQKLQKVQRIKVEENANEKELESIEALTSLQERLTKQLKRNISKDQESPRQTDKVECNICRKIFTRAYLPRHIESHKYQEKIQRQQQKNEHACLYCNKRLKYKRDWTTHMMKHEGLLEKKYKCSQCDKAFYKAAHLREHSAVHSKEHAFQCKLCVKSFTVRANLKRHLRTVHQDDIELGDEEDRGGVMGDRGGVIVKQERE